MLSGEFILAAVLLTATPVVEIHKNEIPLIECLRPSLVALAVNAQILDTREQTYWLINDPLGDLVTLRIRNDTYLTAPTLADLMQFPDRKSITSMLQVNRAYRNDFILRQSVDAFNDDLIRQAIEDSDAIYHIYDMIRDATCDYYYITVRRDALVMLRTLMGDEAFYTGRLPPHVPTWHIPRN